jgi:hypothetical protein
MIETTMRTRMRAISARKTSRLGCHSCIGGSEEVIGDAVGDVDAEDVDVVTEDVDRDVDVVVDELCAITTIELSLVSAVCSELVLISGPISV